MITSFAPPRTARCSACKASIWFGLTPAGKRMPLDVQSVDDGNVIVDRDELALRVVTGGWPCDGAPTPELPPVRVLRKTDVVDADVPRYRSHFARCPKAASFRTAAGSQ